MHRVRIKICGICRVEDAVAAAQAGADAIGVNLHPPARRGISVDHARQIVAALPPFVTPVALFVDEDVRIVRDHAVGLGVRHVQLHGHETPEQVAELRDLTVIKAIRVTRDGLAEELEVWRRAIDTLTLSHVAGLLLETGGTPQAGGSGVENDWTAIREAQNAGLFDGLPPMIAAGGLRPDNVADVVRTLRPWAVDVSSGVEDASRQKSAEKMSAFVQAARSA